MKGIKNNITQKDCHRVLLYTSISRLFRTTLVGHLYEIAQVYPVVLLSEKLDTETEKILHNKELFPKLEKIIPIRQQRGGMKGLLAKYNYHRYLCRLSKNVVEEYRPDIVIMSDDFTVISRYLIRFARKIKAMTICFQASFRMEIKRIGLWSDLMNMSQKNFPSFFPFWLKMKLVRIRKYLSHFFEYYLLPLIVGQASLGIKSSYIIWSKREVGMYADYYIVFSKRDYNLSLQEGVPIEKLYILNHPLEHKNTRRFFKEAYSLNSLSENVKDRKVLTIMLPSVNLGFRKNNYSLISEEQITKNRKEAIILITKTLKDWQIFIKPHPQTDQSLYETFFSFKSISSNIKICDIQEPADKYIEISDVVLGFPPCSTTLFIASLQSQEKVILSLNLQNELLGDFYRGFKGVEYIDNRKKFIRVLEKIRDNKYTKHNRKPDLNKFSNAVNILRYLSRKESIVESSEDTI